MKEKIGWATVSNSEIEVEVDSGVEVKSNGYIADIFSRLRESYKRATITHQNGSGIKSEPHDKTAKLQ